MSTRASRRANGFTMIELVLVMVLIGALSIFALPAFFERGGFNAYAYLQELQAAARFAQKTAMASGCDVEFSVSPAGYQLRYRSGGSATQCGSGGFTVALTGPDGANYAGSTPAGVTVGTLSRYFDALGRVRNAGGGESGGSVNIGTHSLSIETGTGYVHG